MKQMVLSIQVFQGSDKVHEISNANATNIQSCIDLWHSPGTKIELLFDEIDVPLSSDGNVALNV